jgi:hypothetical protein
MALKRYCFEDHMQIYRLLGYSMWVVDWPSADLPYENLFCSIKGALAVQSDDVTIPALDLFDQVSGETILLNPIGNGSWRATDMFAYIGC